MYLFENDQLFGGDRTAILDSGISFNIIPTEDFKKMERVIKEKYNLEMKL